MFGGPKSGPDTSQRSGAGVGILRRDVSLHERVRGGLEQGFRESLSDVSSEADLLVHQGPRVAVFEVKTGGPDLPLPSSTSAQMLLLKERVRRQFPAQEIEEVVPIVVTNYKVSPDDQKELADLGITVVRIDPAASRSYDFGKLSRHVAALTGLQITDRSDTFG